MIRPVHSRVSRKSTPINVLALACAVLAFCLSSPAHAVAPMCDPQAQSIAAPATMQPVKEGKLDSTPCASELLEHFYVGPRAPDRVPELTLDLGQRVMPSLLACSLRAPSQRLSAPDPSTGPALPALTSGIYRPPRA